MNNNLKLLHEVRIIFEDNGVEVIMVDSFDFFHNCIEYAVKQVRIGEEYFYKTIPEMVAKENITKIGLYQVEKINILDTSDNINIALGII